MRPKYQLLLCQSVPSLLLLLILLCLYKYASSGNTGPLESVVGRSVESVGYTTCDGNISQAAYDGLQALYLSTAGQSWEWNEHLPKYTIWTFPVHLSVPC